MQIEFKIIIEVDPKGEGGEELTEEQEIAIDDIQIAFEGVLENTFALTSIESYWREI